jgi:hypothetical protein
MRYRRYRVQSSTLADNLRILGSLYTWAKTSGGFDLDDYLTQGNILTLRQIEAFASTLRLPETLMVTPIKDIPDVSSALIDAGTFDHALSITEHFLLWSLDSMNRGGISRLTLEQLMAERAQLNYLFHSLRIGARPSQRLEPLEEQEITQIRQAIGPEREAQGLWVFPERVFSEHTRLRNWLMFETALELGARRGELLKLRLDSLPRGREDGILILRILGRKNQRSRQQNASFLHLANSSPHFGSTLPFPHPLAVYEAKVPICLWLKRGILSPWTEQMTLSRISVATAELHRSPGTAFVILGRKNGPNCSSSNPMARISSSTSEDGPILIRQIATSSIQSHNRLLISCGPITRHFTRRRCRDGHSASYQPISERFL